MQKRFTRYWLSTILSLLIFVLLSGCAAFRLHDAGSLKTAQEAVTTTKEIQETGFSAFTAMEENLDTAATAGVEVRTVLNEAVLKTFETQFSEMTSADIAREVEGAKAAHDATQKAIDEALKEAKEEIQNSLNRQKGIKQLQLPANIEKDCDEKVAADVAKQLPDDKPSTEAVAVKKRLCSVVDTAKHFQGKANTEGEPYVGRDAVNTTANVVQAVIAKVLPSLAPEEVKEVQELFDQVRQEALLAETRRLQEMQRYLATVEGMKKEFDRRDELWQLLEINVGILNSPKFGNYWSGRKLLEFVQNCLKTCKNTSEDPHRVAALKALTALSILLFVEQPLDNRAAIAATAEQHRYSIRLSKVNAEQRLTLISQITDGLQAYYEGGIKPEEVAQLALMAGQVGALGFIGAQQ